MQDCERLAVASDLHGLSNCTQNTPSEMDIDLPLVGTIISISLHRCGIGRQASRIFFRH